MLETNLAVVNKVQFESRYSDVNKRLIEINLLNVNNCASEIKTGLVSQSAPYIPPNLPSVVQDSIVSRILFNHSLLFYYMKYVFEYTVEGTTSNEIMNKVTALRLQGHPIGKVIHKGV